ncbi:hypothetical protein [Ornithinimicrobium cerasi]|uniref:Uncharacterized protein n=1 Tax=Ornithinimicrobium cerasi TaxID=2248773 RepID=A0A285VQV1_9MICO|nr:hypothetical protein [Ornithinimicrobium cerasi]SOC56415.1 hypothetical protein SAMN05421879_107172 [Ornithinimicrobium cerasi]
MASPNLAKLALKYGPIVYTLAQKYGPQVVEQVLRQRDPAQKFVSNQRERGTARKQALAHAESVIDGAVQQVFHGGQAYWVVFSRNEPVGTHPHTTVPYDSLLLNADPARRVSPADLRRTVHLPRRPRR